MRFTDLYCTSWKVVGAAFDPSGKVKSITVQHGKTRLHLHVSEEHELQPGDPCGVV